MKDDHQIVNQVMTAKTNVDAADDLIRTYLPFINAEVSRFVNRFVTEDDEEVTIGMMAFHEAIMGYTSTRGSFFAYAALLIRSRLIDYKRSESRHYGIVSLDETIDTRDGSEETLLDKIPATYGDAQQEVKLQATQKEIMELSKILKEFGVSLSDIAENSPKQQRSLETCRTAIRYAKNNPEILDELLLTKKLPLKKLIDGSGANRKTIERHRAYVVTMLIILTNGFDIIRGHLVNVYQEKGGFYS